MAVRYAASLHGGPAAAMAILDADEWLPRDALAKSIDEQNQLQLRVKQAARITPTDSNHATRLMKAYLEYQIRTEQLEVTRQRLALMLRQEQDRLERNQHQRTVVAQREQQKADALAAQAKERDWQRNRELVMLREFLAAYERDQQRDHYPNALAELHWENEPKLKLYDPGAA